MINSNTQKLIVIVAVLMILIFIGYSTFTKSLENSTPVAPTGLDATIPANGSGTFGQDILVLVDKLRKVSIKQDIFSSALFTNLVDFSIPLAPESIGRPNPFAPVGSDFTTTLVQPTGQSTSTPRSL